MKQNPDIKLKIDLLKQSSRQISSVIDAPMEFHKHVEKAIEYRKDLLTSCGKILRALGNAAGASTYSMAYGFAYYSTYSATIVLSKASTSMEDLKEEILKQALESSQKAVDAHTQLNDAIRDLEEKIHNASEKAISAIRNKTSAILTTNQDEIRAAIARVEAETSKAAACDAVRDAYNAALEVCSKALEDAKSHVHAFKDAVVLSTTYSTVENIASVTTRAHQNVSELTERLKEAFNASKNDAAIKLASAKGICYDEASSAARSMLGISKEIRYAADAIRYMAFKEIDLFTQHFTKLLETVLHNSLAHSYALMESTLYTTTAAVTIPLEMVGFSVKKSAVGVFGDVKSIGDKITTSVSEGVNNSLTYVGLPETGRMISDTTEFIGTGISYFVSGTAATVVGAAAGTVKTADIGLTTAAITAYYSPYVAADVSAASCSLVGKSVDLTLEKTGLKTKYLPAKYTEHERRETFEVISKLFLSLGFSPETDPERYYKFYEIKSQIYRSEEFDIKEASTLACYAANYDDFICSVKALREKTYKSKENLEKRIKDVAKKILKLEELMEFYNRYSVAITKRDVLEEIEYLEHLKRKSLHSLKEELLRTTDYSVMNATDAILTEYTGYSVSGRLIGGGAAAVASAASAATSSAVGSTAALASIAATGGAPLIGLAGLAGLAGLGLYGVYSTAYRWGASYYKKELCVPESVKEIANEVDSKIGVSDYYEEKKNTTLSKLKGKGSETASKVAEIKAGAKYKDVLNVARKVHETVLETAATASSAAASASLTSDERHASLSSISEGATDALIGLDETESRMYRFDQNVELIKARMKTFSNLIDAISKATDAANGFTLFQIAQIKDHTLDRELEAIEQIKKSIDDVCSAMNGIIFDRDLSNKITDYFREFRRTISERERAITQTEEPFVFSGLKRYDYMKTLRKHENELVRIVSAVTPLFVNQTLESDIAALNNVAEQVQSSIDGAIKTAETLSTLTTEETKTEGTKAQGANERKHSSAYVEKTSVISETFTLPDDALAEIDTSLTGAAASSTNRTLTVDVFSASQDERNRSRLDSAQNFIQFGNVDTNAVSRESGFRR